MPVVPELVSNRVLSRSILWSILLIVFGFVAIASPMGSSIGAALGIAWLIFIGGLVQLVHAFQSKGIGHIVWKFLAAAFYLAVGVYLITHPLLGLAGLTLAIAIFFCAVGIADVIAWFSTRKSGGSAWMLVNGIVTLILGFMIWSQWPVTSLWFLGTLVGICMLMAGTSRLMMALAVRKLLRDPGSSPYHERRAA